ncbi:MAG: hypothetical protein K5919_03645 [Clostridiales bacterium]|nr:hypothetical protein [Clostridiales bacterium]
MGRKQRFSVFFWSRVWISDDDKSPKTDKTKTPPAFMDQGFWGLELMAGFEPATSSLPNGKNNKIGAFSRVVFLPIGKYAGQ